MSDNGDKTVEKKRSFLILDTVYAITRGASAEIEKCSHCRGCPCETSEAGEYVTLIPDEAEYMAYRLRMAKRQDLASLVPEISESGICPFLKEERCSIHDVRPIDCRSYPLVPQFEGNNIRFAMSKLCPYWMEIGDEFVRLFKRAWLMLSPLLDEAWRKQYAVRNRTPIHELHVCNRH
jgi:Fe-S-cluster containining protein